MFGQAPSAPLNTWLVGSNSKLLTSRASALPPADQLSVPHSLPARRSWWRARDKQVRLLLSACLLFWVAEWYCGCTTLTRRTCVLGTQVFECIWTKEPRKKTKQNRTTTTKPRTSQRHSEGLRSTPSPTSSYFLVTCPPENWTWAELDKGRLAQSMVQMQLVMLPSWDLHRNHGDWEVNMKQTPTDG